MVEDTRKSGWKLHQRATDVRCKPYSRHSIDQNQSCADCHGSEAGWTGPDSVINADGAVYEGSIPGRFGDRKPPSAAYATLSPIFHQDMTGLFVGGNFWDGRATADDLNNPAADQAKGPFLNPKEQALPDSACVVYRVCNPVVPFDYPSRTSPLTTSDCRRIRRIRRVSHLTLSTRDSVDF